MTDTERLLLMAAAFQGLRPGTTLLTANAYRVIDQVLSWRGLTAEEIQQGWQWEDCDPIHKETYDALVRMIHAGRNSKEPGPPLFVGNGNWGVPGDPNNPPCWPHFNSCCLTPEGDQLAQELLRQNPELRNA